MSTKLTDIQKNRLSKLEPQLNNAIRDSNFAVAKVE